MINNIFWVRAIMSIGGTEQFLQEIVKKYKDKEIIILYDECDKKQYNKLSKYVKLVHRDPTIRYKCKRVFINNDSNIGVINQIDAEEYIYVGHVNFELDEGWYPKLNNKITKVIAVSNYIGNKFKKLVKKLKLDIPVEVSYNPLTLEKKEKVLKLISAGRLDDKQRDNGRHKIFMQHLDKYCEEHNTHYVWLVFSNPMKEPLKSKNVCIMEKRLDVRPYIANADFLINLANDMETYGYSNNEALEYGVRIVTTPLSVIKEYNAPKGSILTCNYDMSNVDEVIDKMFNTECIFEYKAPQDKWNEIL